MIAVAELRMRVEMWAWRRLDRFEGQLLDASDLYARDWAAFLLTPGGRAWIRARWRTWTALPGDRVYDVRRMVVGEVVKVRRAGRIDVIAAGHRVLHSDPLALDRPWPDLCTQPMFVVDDRAPGGGYVTPHVQRGSLLSDWTR